MLQKIIYGIQENGRETIDYNKILILKIKTRLSLDNVEFEHNIRNSKELNSLSWEIKLEAEKILQELVTNVLKHAKAGKVVLEIYIENSYLYINFKDDGQGFDRGENRDGFGLTNIYKRIETVNGEIQMVTSRNKGAHFIIVIPA
ncbi:MAG: hypothetical protein JRD93_18615 [Deltaproteobacteria bacterium]|nr:hypothetical protein [Deltaproteobacteria bacterium]